MVTVTVTGMAMVTAMVTTMVTDMIMVMVMAQVRKLILFCMLIFLFFV